MSDPYDFGLGSPAPGDPAQFIDALDEEPGRLCHQQQHVGAFAQLAQTASMEQATLATSLGAAAGPSTAAKVYYQQAVAEAGEADALLLLSLPPLQVGGAGLLTCSLVIIR